ncbi:uncharacterized protein EI97DRAFT_89708 [Westerdykella ornata]|uniref:Uncharacterized protein n=1 Tax=Westerdykella ornata TaxID=318751 RepID=A0A6A6JHT4_WESOR|nr:uncharacterized protein EI97DRAFT_89708 [Westerdykella ornata]KAF2274809.1 hypothetical protein EI97DRAFT_89708 [Westerdykella ornata]
MDGRLHNRSHGGWMGGRALGLVWCGSTGGRSGTPRPVHGQGRPQAMPEPLRLIYSMYFDGDTPTQHALSLMSCTWALSAIVPPLETCLVNWGSRIVVKAAPGLLGYAPVCTLNISLSLSPSLEGAIIHKPRSLDVPWPNGMVAQSSR